MVLFVDVIDDMVIVCEEIFGFVLLVLDFEIEVEVMECVNVIEFGLVVGVFMFDLICVYCVVVGFEVGICYINIYNFVLVEVLFGGVKMLGVGCENFKVVIVYYFEFKIVYVVMNLCEVLF